MLYQCVPQTYEKCYGPKTLMRTPRLALVKDFLRVTLIESGKPRTRVWVSLSQGTFPGSHCPQTPRISMDTSGRKDTSKPLCSCYLIPLSSPLPLPSYSFDHLLHLCHPTEHLLECFIFTLLCACLVSPKDS